MTVSKEILDRISIIDKVDHIRIVDSYCALGRDPMTIAIRQGVDLEDLLNVLRAYNFNLDSQWGGNDENCDLGQFKRVPESLVKSFVSQYYPGVLDNENGKDVTLTNYIREGISR